MPTQVSAELNNPLLISSHIEEHRGTKQRSSRARVLHTHMACVTKTTQFKARQVIQKKAFYTFTRKETIWPPLVPVHNFSRDEKKNVCK